MAIIAFNLQGRPLVIGSGDGEPKDFKSMEAAREWLNQAHGNHLGITAAESIVIVDVDSGETDLWL